MVDKVFHILQRDAVGAIIVYDITKEDTYRNVVRWVKDVRSNTNNRDISIMLGQLFYVI